MHERLNSLTQEEKRILAARLRAGAIESSQDPLSYPQPMLPNTSRPPQQITGLAAQSALPSTNLLNAPKVIITLQQSCVPL